jgi:hypothetical protein
LNPYRQHQIFLTSSNTYNVTAPAGTSDLRPHASVELSIKNIHLRLIQRTGGEPEHMRTNPKAILAAIGVAALLASSAMAKTARHHHAAPSIVRTPSDAQRSVAPCGYGSFDNPVNPPCHEAFGFCTC